MSEIEEYEHILNWLRGMSVPAFQRSHEFIIAVIMDKISQLKVQHD